MAGSAAVDKGRLAEAAKVDGGAGSGRMAGSAAVDKAAGSDRLPGAVSNEKTADGMPKKRRGRPKKSG
jgi:hypothetical protein